VIYDATSSAFAYIPDSSDTEPAHKLRDKMLSLRRYIRSAETYFPSLHDSRFACERALRRAFRVPHDSDWYAFRLLKIGSGNILDIGANRGLSIQSFRTMLPGRRIIAFEPNKHLADILKSAYRRSVGVEIRATGLSDCHGTAVLYIPQYRGWVFDSLASVYRDPAMAWLNRHTLAGFDARHLTCIEVNVTLQKLDDLELEGIAVMKIDAQGSEIRILRGAMSIISESRPIILAEDVGTEIVHLLNPLGYRPYIYRQGSLLPDRVDAVNVFLLHTSHLQTPLPSNHPGAGAPEAG